MIYQTHLFPWHQCIYLCKSQGNLQRNTLHLLTMGILSRWELEVTLWCSSHDSQTKSAINISSLLSSLLFWALFCCLHPCFLSILSLSFPFLPFFFSYDNYLVFHAPLRWLILSPSSSRVFPLLSVFFLIDVIYGVEIRPVRIGLFRVQIRSFPASFQR